MTDDQIIQYLRSRGRVEPPVDLVSSVMDAIDRPPQRRSWFAPFIPALAAAGAVAIIVALAVLIGQGGPPTGTSESPTQESSTSPSPSASTEPTVAPSTQPTGEPFGAPVFADPDSCEDDSVGYRVAFPDAWWWNEPFASEIGPHANCRYFAPNFFDAATVSREQPIPEGVAIFASVIGPEGGLGQVGDVVSSEELTVAGQPAMREEQEYAPGGFLEPGGRIYRYVIELSEGRQLAFTANNQVGDYDENREVLDGMRETLELFEPDEICGPDGNRFRCGQIIVGLVDGAGEPIETIVERNGGNPATDIIDRLDEISAYVIDVPNGTEGDAISRYLMDEAVEYAELNGAEGEVVE
jgi:hypothetical protein